MIQSSISRLLTRVFIFSFLFLTAFYVSVATASAQGGYAIEFDSNVNDEPILADSNAGTELIGFAWSGYTNQVTGGREGVGWISMNCENDGLSGCGTSNYKVKIDTDTGNMSGYAWSPNIGWINFDPVGSYPSGSNTFNGSAEITGSLPDVDMRGWARACSVFQNENSCSGALKASNERGDWDGWISLSGVGTDGSTYGVKFVNNQATGNSFAWGGQINVGWVDFSPDFPGVQPVTITTTVVTDIVTTQVLDTPGTPDIDGNYTVTFSPMVQGIPEGETVSWELSVGPFSDSGEVTQTSGATNFSTIPTINGVPFTTTDNLVFEIDTNNDVVETPPGEDNNVFTRPFSLAFPLPTIDISGPEIVSAGTAADIDVRVTAPYDTTCQVFGPGFSAPSAQFDVLAGVPYINTFTSAALRNSTNIAVRCDVPGDSPFTANISVEVVPTFQEV